MRVLSKRRAEEANLGDRDFTPQKGRVPEVSEY